MCGLGLMFGAVPFPAGAEWYVAGFGGITSKSEFTQVEMPKLGESLASTTTDPDLTNPTGNPFFQLNQNLQTDDVKLKQSWVAGWKAGYFFDRFGFSWLGVEIEGFSTNPKIKSQTVSGTQDVTRYNPTAAPDGPSDNTPPGSPDQEPVNFSIPRSISLDKSNLFVTTFALNGVVRYPGEFLQPYAGAGIGLFWFKGSNEFSNTEVQPGLNAFAGLKVKATDQWGVFFEGKYNRTSLEDFGKNIGLRGNYTMWLWVGGVSYHF